MVTASSSNIDDGATELTLYEWTPPQNVTSPNEDADREGGENVGPKSEATTKPKEPPLPPTPGKLQPLTSITVPTIERLRDVLVYSLDYSHYSRKFLAVCPPDAEKDGSIAVRVVRRDGNMQSNALGMWPELPEKWRATDTMIVDPHSGRVVAVTSTSIMTFEL